MKQLSEANPPHPWDPESPSLSLAVDHLPAYLGMWNKFQSCISLSLSILESAGHAESVFTVFPSLQPAGSGLVVVTGRLLPRVVDAALRLDVKFDCVQKQKSP